MNENTDQRPVLRYVEFHAADHCNLNCRACSHFASLFNADVFPDTQGIIRDFLQLSMLFRSVNTVRILGGEPLLNPELPQIISGIREIMPQSEISIVTNGLLLKKWGSLLARLLVSCGIVLYVTRYPVGGSAVQDGIRLFKNEGVNVIESPEMSYFRLFLRKDRDSGSGFGNCRVKGCTFLCDGHLYVCALCALVKRYNQVFSAAFPEEDGVDLYQVRSGKDVLEKFGSAWKLCGYCSDNNRFVKWSRTDAPEARDWL